MITCKVCQSTNHHLATICVSCGSYIQPKVDNLDLFSTAWKVIESPSRGFRTVALATHKNFCVFISSAAGVGIAFTLFWFIHFGDIVPELFSLLLIGLLFGFVVGPLTVLVFSLILKAVTAIGRMRIRFRNIYASAAYALTPVLLSVLFILPIELLTFGSFMFSRNPSPYLLRPFSYIMMIGFDAVCALWTVILMTIALKTLTDESWGRVLAAAVASIALFAGFFGLVVIPILAHLQYYL